MRRSDSRLFLTDFGSSIYPGADTLTPSPIPPGTPAYRAPEAWLFSVQHSRAATAHCTAEPADSRAATVHYTAEPADDLYALGVTACRLATGAYPAMGEAHKDDHGTWRLKPLVLPEALHSARVEPPLRALILRMLSLRPEERGTAAQLARELERAATSLENSSSVPSHPQARTRPWRSWLATAAAAGALAAWVGWMALGAAGESPRAAQTETTAAEQKDTGPVGLGETAASTSTGDSPAPPTPEAMATDTPPEPLPGQASPDARGRCPHKRQVALNGGCWRKTPADQCEEFSGRMYKGTCYVPIFAPGRPSTATPTKQP